MIVARFIERLKQVATPPFALVEGAAELASLGNGQPNALPAAYVFISEEAASENERVNAVVQRMEMDVSIVVICGNVSDAVGGAASADVESLKAAVRSAVIGWRPEGADDVVTNVGGRLVRARDGLVWWELTFATAIYLEG